METGDGYLVRLRLSGGILTPRRAMRLAELSEHFGNGQLELSSRANLQLRGIAERHLDDIRTELDKLGLLDKSEAAEAVRNVIVTALEQRLLAEAALQALPGKFGFAIDDGGSLPLGTGITDVVALAMTADWMALFLGGVFAGTGASARLPDIAAQCARAFIELRGDERRMAPLVARVGVEAVRAKAGIEPGTDATGWRPAPAVVGYLDTGLFGLGLPFGAMTAAQLAFIAGRADEIRLSPWRVLFLTGRGVTPNLAADAEAQGLIAKPDDARLAVTACPGSPACASAHTPARRDAERLASLAPALGPGVSLHVSGCAKGCARAEKTAVTLTGAPDGYKLILAGKADDHPIANGLDLAAAEALLRRLETPR
jgi:precorrin-3B synthase